jgi:hypothetical protein
MTFLSTRTYGMKLLRTRTSVKDVDKHKKMQIIFLRATTREKRNDKHMNNDN